MILGGNSNPMSGGAYERRITGANYVGNIGSNSNKSLRQMLDDMEKEQTYTRNGYPIHCPPLRTGSGVRFGW